MDSDRRISIIVGALFILATVSSALGFVILDPILDDADILASFSASEGQALFGGLLILINAILVVVIGVLLFSDLEIAE